jgi:hypothetical protein
LSNRIGGGGGGIVKGTSLFFLLNIMIRSSPTCLIKKKTNTHTDEDWYPRYHPT